MAKHLSVLRRFKVSTERDDGGITIEHRYKKCDWDAWIDGCRITDLMRQANAHAKVCDGKPQPRPERPAGLSNSFVSSLWAAEIGRALAASLVFEQNVAAYQPSAASALNGDPGADGGTVSV